MTFREDGTGGARLGGALPRARRRAAGARAGRAGRHPLAAAAPPPSRASRSRPCSATSTRSSCPAITHWQHPRFFAYFAVIELGARHPRRAARRDAEQNAILWRTSPASTELEPLVLDWVAQLLGLAGRVARAHRGHRVDLDARGADRGAPRDRPERRRLLGARALLDREGGADARHGAAEGCRSTTSSGCGRTALDLDDAAAVVATVGTTSTASVDPVPAIADAVRPPGRGCTSTPPTRARRWSARSSAGRSRASSAPTRSSSTRTSGCSRRWTARCSGRRRPDEFRDGVQLVPEYLRTTDEDAFNLSEYGPALGRRFRSLKLWAVLRCYGREGLQRADSRGDPAGRAVRGLGARRAGLGALRAARASRSSASGARAPTRRTRRSSSGSTRAARSSSRTRSSTAATCCASRSGNERTTEDDVRRAWDVLRREADAL